MSYGHNGKPSCCYKCEKRVLGCHSFCKEFAEEKEEKISDKKKKNAYLYPAHSRYFKQPEKVASSSAKQSKKRYR